MTEFRSNYSIYFYISVLLLCGILGLTSYNVQQRALDIQSFFLINIGALLILYYNFLQYECRISLINEDLEFNYPFSFKKKISVPTGQIVEVDKHEDSVHRTYQIVFIRTPAESFLIRYIISSESERKFFAILGEIISKEES